MPSQGSQETPMARVTVDDGEFGEQPGHARV